MGWRRRPRGLACSELRDLVTDYLEYALDDADRRRFDAHLDACADCRAAVASFAQTVNALQALPDEELSEESLAALLAAFRATMPEP